MKTISCFLAFLVCVTAGSAEFTFNATTDNTQISEVTDYATMPLSIAPAGFWTALSDASDTDGHTIRVFQSDGTTALEFYIGDIDTTGHTGRLYFQVGEMSTSSDATYVIAGGNSALSAAGDSAAVFSGTNVAAFWDFVNGSLVDLVSGLTLTNSGTATAATGAYEGVDAYSFNGSSQYLYTASPPVSDWPSSFWAAFLMDNTTTDGNIIGESSTANDQYLMRIYAAGTVGSPTDPVRAHYRGSEVATGSIATTSTGFTSSTWHTGAGTRDTDSSGTTTAYINGGSAGTNSTNINAAPAFNRLSIGALVRASVSTYLAGDVSVCTVFNTSISANYVSTLEAMWENSGFWTAGTPSGTVTITAPVSYQTYQRNGSNQASISISGTYTGTPAAIEADFNGGGYATIDASPSGGTFSGTLSAQAAGQGTLTVRWTDDTGVTDTVAYVGIGDVYLVAGQSNASGRGTNNQSYSHASLRASMFREDQAWAQLSDPTDSDDGLAAGSPWPLVATLAMADQSVPVAFITTADGGTGLVNPTNDWEVDGTGVQYEDCIAIVTASGVNAIKAIIWYQGESDAVNGVSQASYNAALDALYTAFAADLPGGATPLICTMIGNIQGAYVPAGGTGDIDKIRFAQKEAWDDNAGIYPGPVLIDIDLTDSGGDGLHLKTNTELSTYAARCWAAIDEAVFDGTAGRGPQLTTAHYHTGDAVLVTVDKTTTTSGSLSSGVFSLLDDATPVTVNTGCVSGTTAALIPASTLAGVITLSYGLGNSAAGLAVITGGDSNALPAEPISGLSVTATVSGGPIRRVGGILAR